MKRILLLITLFKFLNINLLHSNGELSNWVYYNKHISFNNYCNDTLISLQHKIETLSFLKPWVTIYFLDSIIPYSFLISHPEISTISDKFGNLLFFSDGYGVWNKEFKVMENGDSIIDVDFTFMQKIPSSFDLATKVTITPYPGVDSTYYIFVRQLPDESYRFEDPFVSYSIVDLRMNNGLGKVLEKRKYILNRKKEYIEYLPIMHQNQKDIWLILIDTNKIFQTLLVTKDGIIDLGIRDSTVLKSVSGQDSTFSFIAIPLDGGCTNKLLCSPDGETILCPVYNNLNRPYLSCVLMKFDRANGKISKPIYIPSPVDSNYFFHTHRFAFSPDGSKLFSFKVYSRIPSSQFTFQIEKFDLLIWDSTVINNSRKTIYSSNLQRLSGTYPILGIDGKFYRIYYLDTNTSVAIKNPNDDSIIFELIRTPFFWPSLDQNFFHQYLFKLIKYQKPVCLGSPLHLSLSPFVPKKVLIDSTLKVEWSGPNNFYSTELAPTIPSMSLSNFGWYKVNIKTDKVNLIDSIYIPKPNLARIQKSFISSTESVDTLVLFLDRKFSYIQWSNGSKDTLIKVTEPGKYWVYVIDTTCCESSDTVEIDYIGKPRVVEIFMPDTIAKIGEKNFCVPIYARCKGCSINKNLSYTCEIKLNSKFFLPDEIYNNKVEDYIRTIFISGEIGPLDSFPKIIGRFCGSIFLGDNTKEYLKFGNFELQDSSFSLEFKDGSILLLGICQPSLSQVELLPEIKIHNISSGQNNSIEMLIISNYEGDAQITVFDLLGRKIASLFSSLKKGKNIVYLKETITKGPYLVYIKTQNFLYPPIYLLFH